MNNSIINPINVRDGYYYYFVQPYTEYKLYSLNSTNNTLKLIDTIIGKHVGFTSFTNQSCCKITSGEQIVKLKKLKQYI